MPVTAEEVARHADESDCWVIVQSTLVGTSPSCSDSGKDATEEIDMLHEH